MTDNQTMTQRVIDEAVRKFQETLDSKLVESDDKQLALRALEVCAFWANEAIQEDTA